MVLLREAVRARPDRGRWLRTLAISERWEQRLETVVRQLDRSGAGEGIRWLLRMAWREGEWSHQPYSLGGFAAVLRRRARRRRREGRMRKPGAADRELERLRAKGLA